MVEVGTGTAKTRFVRTAYPYSEGLTAGTTKLSKRWLLTPSTSSKVASKDKAGLL